MLPSAYRESWYPEIPGRNRTRSHARLAQALTRGNPSASLANLRKNMSIVLLNEERQPVHRYLFYRCWVSEYQALPFLDAGTPTTAFERITVENEGWERDTSLAEPQEQ